MKVARIWYDGLDWCGYIEGEEHLNREINRRAEQVRLLEDLKGLGATHYRLQRATGKLVTL